METIFTRIAENCELRNFSENTRKTYVRMNRQYAEFFNASPDSQGTEEIRQYLLHLKNEKGQAAKTLEVTYAALQFLYSTVLDRPWEITPVPRVKRENKLPVILSSEEIKSLFSVITNHPAIGVLTAVWLQKK